MESKTQILLKELVEAVKNLDGLVEAVSHTDWWSFGATVFAALVAAWITYVLGKRQSELQQQQLKLQEQQNEIQKYQTKLQEQQIQLQEDELYRRIYTQIFELDFFNKTILLRIVAILICNEDNKLRLKLIEDVRNERNALSDKFGECTFDIDLKKCGEGIDVKYYYDALEASNKVLLMFKYFLENELLVFDPHLINVVPMDHTTTPQTFIDAILQLFRGSNPQFLQNELLAYVRIVEKTNKAQLLKIIKNRITPTNTK